VVGGRASLAQWLLIRTTADGEWLRPANWVVDWSMAYRTILQYTTTDSRERNMGVLCQAQHAGSEEEGGEGRGERGEEGDTAQEKHTHQIKSKSVGPGHLGNGSGKEDRTGANLQWAPRLFLPQSSELSAATPRHVQTLQSDSRAPGFMASGSRETIGEGPFPPPTQ
jgi:hypothetical protein